MGFDRTRWQIHFSYGFQHIFSQNAINEMYENTANPMNDKKTIPAPSD